ncbi:MAG: DMT family transporter [Muribaculaceae bacterium]|nr:DMT family transporter [Muribaculaceae bacterium]
MASPIKSKYVKGLAHLGAFLTASAWGTSFLSTKVLMVDGGFSPVEMYVYRFAMAYILLLCFTFRRILANNWRDELQLMLCGVCAGSLYFITENYALQHTTTGNVSLLASVSPLFTAAIMALIFRVKIGFGVIVGSLVAFAGVACVIFSNGEGFVIKPEGDLLALSAALSWAIYSLAAKRLIPLYSGLFITRKLFFYGVITALPLLLIHHSISGQPYHISTLFNFSHPEFFLNFMFLVVVCSMLAYLVWNQVLSVLGPVVANNYLYIQPLVTMIAAYFVLGEKIYTLGYIGCILIIGGLILADKLKVNPRRSQLRKF